MVRPTCRVVRDGHFDGGLDGRVIDGCIHVRIQRGGKAGGGDQGIDDCREHASLSGWGALPAPPNLNPTLNARPETLRSGLVLFSRIVFLAGQNPRK